MLAINKQMQIKGQENISQATMHVKWHRVENYMQKHTR